MNLLVVGLNHKTASVAIREQAALVPEKIEDFLKTVNNQKIVKGIIALSTCNRTEFYIDSLNISLEDFYALWAKYATIDAKTLTEYHYLLKSDEAVLHLFKVASGLDSLILGEPQIMGQLKEALRASVDQKIAKKTLHRLFQLAFHVAKRVRTETDIGAYTVSVAYTAVQLAKQIFDLPSQKVLLVGAGETIELVARHLLEAGVKTLSVANRTAERATTLVKNLNIEAPIHALNELPLLIEHADIIIASTAASNILITKAMAKHALKKRKNRPILMVDLAIPRDIDETIGTLDDIYLYSVDDLNSIVEKNHQSREKAAREAEQYLQEGLSEWQSWCDLANLGSSLNIVDQYAQKQKKITKHKINNLLVKGVDSTEALSQFGNQLTNRMLHPLINVMKKLEQKGDQEMIDLIMQEFINNSQETR